MPIRDRLSEFQQQMELSNKGEQNPSNGSCGNKMDKDSVMQMFLTDAGKIEAELAKMKADIASMKKLQKNMLSTPFVDKKDVASYESLGEKVRLDASRIGDSLKQLEKKYNTTGFSDDSTLGRVRTQQLSSLTTELNVQTNEFFKIQAEYMDKMKANLRRQLSARGDSGADDAKISTILDKDAYSVFTDNYISNVNDAEQTLRDLEERKKDILALEKSVTDVNLLFKDLNLLISSQGETLVRIEDAIERTVEHVDLGNQQLKKAKEYQSQARRKKCFIIVVILVVLAVVALILGIVFGTRSS